MVFDTFRSYYYTPQKASWLDWDPDLQHRGKKSAEKWELVDIDAAAKKYAAPESVKIDLDRLITQEVYEHLIGEEIDKSFLEERGFHVIQGAPREGKDSSNTRVIYHDTLPEYFIKVGKAATRDLPMEGITKASKAVDSSDPSLSKKDVWLPIRNGNLLRAAGRDYFVNQLQNLEDPSVPELNAGDKHTFSFSEEYIYTPLHADSEAPPHQKYFSVSKKMDIYSSSETLEIIGKQDVETQRLVARKIVGFIKKTRMHDMHAGNIVLRKDLNDWCFAMIDTEPLGIMIDSEDTGAHLFNPVQHVLLGLIIFRDRYCLSHGLTAMTEEVDKAIVDYIGQHSEAFKADPIEVDSYGQTAISRTGNLHYATTTPQILPATRSQNARFWVMVALSILTVGILPLILLIGAILAQCCCPSGENGHFQSYMTPGHRWFASRA